MKDLHIKISKDYNDAIIISRHIAEIWDNKANKSEYDKMFSYINKFNEGFIIAYLFNEAIGSSIAFPMDKIPTFEEINEKNIYDMMSLEGRYFYIHVI